MFYGIGGVVEVVEVAEDDGRCDDQGGPGECVTHAH